MSITHRYADFGSCDTGDIPEGRQNVDTLEDERLTAFENGYQAGWDDSTKAHQDDNARALADVAQHLQDLSFTYHEAYGKIALALKPLLTQFVTKLMPDILEQSLHAQILHEVTALLEAQAGEAIELAVAPASLEPIKALLTEQLQTPFNIVAEPTLTNGQVYVRVGHAEREINLDGVRAATAEAVAAFFDHAQVETDHG